MGLATPRFASVDRTAAPLWQAVSMPSTPASIDAPADTTVIYTDGACSGNPGPGGWGWVIPDGAFGSGFAPDTTNQRMELTAVLEAVRAVPGRLLIVSDSTYVVNCFRDSWWKGWLDRGWKTSAKKPVANQDLWEPLVELYLEREVDFRWVKGHAGDQWNDIADRLAVEAVINEGGRSGDETPTDLGSPDELNKQKQEKKKTSRMDAPGGHRLVVLGHRPPQIGGYEANPIADRIRRRLADIIEAKSLMFDDLVVVTGLRLGAEQLGAEAAIEAGVPYVAVLPYPEPEKVWPRAAQERFQELLSGAREAQTLQKKAPEDKQKAGAAMARRDAWLAQNSTEALVVWDGADKAVGALVKTLEKHLGDEVWVVDPNAC